MYKELNDKKTIFFLYKTKVLANYYYLTIIIKVFHANFGWRSLSDSKSTQVSRTLLGILADLNIAGFLMVSAFLLISKYSSPWTNDLAIIPSAPITTGTIINFMFHSFFRSHKVQISLHFRFLLFSPCDLSRRQSLLFGRFSFFWLTNTRSGFLVKIRWSAFIPKSQKSLWVSFSSIPKNL